MDSKTCTSCQTTKLLSEFYKNGKDGSHRSRCKDCIKPLFNQAKKTREKGYRLEVLTHYSDGEPCCSCCGEHHIEFLTIDHINGGGNQHRKEIVNGSGDFVRWLRRQGYPEGYRVLCYNCNTAHGLHGYCPHEHERLIGSVHPSTDHRTCREVSASKVAAPLSYAR